MTRFAFGVKCGAFGASGSQSGVGGAGVRGTAAEDTAEQRMQRDGAEADAALPEEPAARLVALILAESDWWRCSRSAIG